MTLGHFVAQGRPSGRPELRVDAVTTVDTMAVIIRRRLSHSLLDGLGCVPTAPTRTEVCGFFTRRANHGLLMKKGR